MSSKDPESRVLNPEKPQQPHVLPRSRNVFILKSLSIILMLTIIVLGINYYLISNCPTASTSEPNQTPQSRSVNDLVSQVHNKLIVSVYYEVLCPDSKSFILHQLVPSYKKYGHLIDLRYVPFGKASYWGDPPHDLQFSCQHGSEECHGNKLHACILESYASQSTQTEMIACAMNSYKLWGATSSSLTHATSECIQKYAPSSAAPPMCANASVLLAKHGKDTNSLNPRVSFIPTITINGSQSNQRQILRDLSSVLCKQLKSTNPELSC